MVEKRDMRAIILAVAIMLCLSLTVVAGEKNDMSIPGVSVKSIVFNDELGLYEVAGANGTLFYLTGDKKYVIIGNIFETKGMKNITEAKKQELFRTKFSDLPFDGAIKMSEGKRKIAVFTTSGCPWCRKLTGELKKLNDVSVYLLLLGGGNDSGVWCEGSVDALERAYRGETLTPKDTCDVTPLKKNAEFARKNGFAGFPTMVFEDGTRIVGYVPVEKIVARMNGSAHMGGK